MFTRVTPSLRTTLIGSTILLLALYAGPGIAFMLQPDYANQTLMGSVNPHDDTALLADSSLTKEDHAFRARILEGYDKGTHSSGFHNPALGILSFKECYTCRSGEEYYRKYETGMAHTYYLGLNGFALRDRSSQPLMIAGKPALQYAVWDRVDTLVDGSLHRAGHYAFKELPYRFGYKNGDKQEGQRGYVMIPITATTYKWLFPGIATLAIILGMLWLYICIAIPLKVLIRIAQGQIFSALNYKQLQWSARTWLLTPFVILAIQALLALVFYRTLTHDVQFVWWETLSNLSTCIIVGLIILIIAQAFKRGLALQNEQALTI